MSICHPMRYFWPSRWSLRTLSPPLDHCGTPEPQAAFKHAYWAEPNGCVVAFIYLRDDQPRTRTFKGSSQSPTCVGNIRNRANLLQPCPSTNFFDIGTESGGGRRHSRARRQISRIVQYNYGKIFWLVPPDGR